MNECIAGVNPDYTIPQGLQGSRKSEEPQSSRLSGGGAGFYSDRPAQTESFQGPLCPIVLSYFYSRLPYVYLDGSC